MDEKGGEGGMGRWVPLTIFPGIMKFAMSPACETSIACHGC